MNRSLSVFFLSSFLLCGCTRNNPVPLDTLVVALSNEPTTLDPRYATDAYGWRVTSLIFNSLVKLGPGLKPVPDASERWTYKNNTYTFYLRRDLTFHNGRKLNPDDVEFSFATAMSPQGPFSAVKDIIKHVKASVVGGQVVVAIELKNFSDKFLINDLPSVKLLPKQELLANPEYFATHLTGTGGYRFIHQDLNQIELEAVNAVSKHLIFKVIHDDFTRYQKMMRGEVDIVQNDISFERVGDFSKQPEKFQVFIYPGTTITYVLVNFHDPVLQNQKVREALAQSIHREELIRYKKQGMAREATSILSPENKYFNAKLKNPEFNLAAASATIRALGLNGHKIILKTANSPDSVDLGKVLANEMSQTGLNVEIQSFEWATYYSDVKQGDFQLATMRWVGIVDPEIYKLSFHSSEKPPGRNRGFYNNAHLDGLLDAGTNEPNIEKRKRIFNEVQEIVQSDFAIIPLWYDQQNAIAKKNVINYHPDQTGDYSSLLEASKVHE